MLRFLASMVGLVCLIAGVVLLGSALLPQINKTTVEVGGTSTTQEQLAAESLGTTYSAEVPPDLPVNIDGEVGLATTNSIGAAPEFDQQGLEEISGFAASDEAVPEIAAQTSGDTITTDTEVAVVPLTFSTTSAQTVTGQGGAAGGGLYEQRTVELEYPKSFRVDGNSAIRLTLKALPGGGVAAVPEIADNALIATPILISDYHDTHNATFTAELRAPELQIEMMTTNSQLLGRGEEATWRWNVKAPKNSGKFVLTFLVNVQWEPKPTAVGASYIPPRTIWSQAVQVEANYVFGGISVPQASMLGTALAVIGFVSQIPMANTLFMYLITSRRRTPPRSTSRSRSTTRRR